VPGNELLLEIVAPRDETSDKLHWRSVFEPGTLTSTDVPLCLTGLMIDVTPADRPEIRLGGIMPIGS